MAEGRVRTPAPMTAKGGEERGERGGWQAVARRAARAEPLPTLCLSSPHTSDRVHDAREHSPATPHAVFVRVGGERGERHALEP